jgi:hypothetical protein
MDPNGLVKWSGSVRSISLTKIAWGRDEYTLQSECKCNLKVSIVVKVDSVGVSLGAGSFRSGVEFEDPFQCPNAMAFAGGALTFSVGGAFRFGTSYSQVRLGAANSPGSWGATEGLGIQAGFAPGYARVVDIKAEQCCSK